MTRTRLPIAQGLHCLLFLLFLSAVPYAAQSQTCPEPPQIDMTGAVSFGDGTPGSCTQAALQALINAGGKISCNCGTQPFTLLLTATLVVPNVEVVIDGKNLLTISGNNSVRIFRKEAALNNDNGTLLGLQNLKLINARLSQDSGEGDLGGAAIAGAAHGSLKVFNVLFENNVTAYSDNVGHANSDDRFLNGFQSSNADACGAVHTVLYKDVSFVNCVFKSNSGANGGAVGGISSAPTFINCLFENNRAVGSGGTFRTGGQGGAIYVDGTFLNGVKNRIDLCGCVFKDNFANHQAGGLYVVQYNNSGLAGSAGAAGSIDKCTFENSTCLNSQTDTQKGSYGGGLGGGIYYIQGDLTLTNSTFSNNSCVGMGGGISYGDGSLNLSNCTLNGNKAVGEIDKKTGLGGGLALTGGPAKITNCTFAENLAGNFASAIFNLSNLTLTNTMFYNNLTGKDYQGNYWAGGTINGSSSLVAGPGNLQWPGGYKTEYGENPENWLTGAANSVLIADAQLQPLADNGGPSKTMALPSTSPAVDKGTGTASTTDQRGFPRVGTADIGAFEFSNPTAPPPCLSSITPANGAVNVALTTSISWTASGLATSYDVYFGTSATPPLIGNQTTTTYTPATPLVANTDYYYKIVPKNSNGDATGCTVASFKSYAPPPCDSYVWTGTSNDWNTAANWCSGAVPGEANDVLIPTGVSVMPTIDETVTCRNLTIQTGASLTLTSGTLQVKGNWSNQGTFTASGGTVVFSGASAQALAGATTFRNLTVENAAGVTLANAVNVRGVLLLQNGALNSNGQLTIDLATGYISGAGNGSIAGNVTLTRNVTGSGWHYLSAPLGSGTASDYADDVALGGGRYYTYDETNPNPNRDYGWVEVNNASTALTKGIAIKTTGNTTFDVTRAYDHTLEPTINSAALTNTGDYGDISTANGWHLVGNPFPSPFDWTSPSIVKNNLANAIYFYNPALAQNASFVGGVGTNGASGTVPAMQAFWVKVNGSNASLTFSKAARSGNTSQGFFRTAALSNVLKLTLTSKSGLNDETAIRLAEGATEGLDADYDAVKFNNPSPGLNLYTQSAGKNLSINSLPLGELTTKEGLTKKVALYFDLPQAGQFMLAGKGLDGFDAAVSVVLEDSLTGTRVNLKEQSAYSFTVVEPGISSRFRVSFTYAPSASAEPVVSTASANVWSWRNQVHVQWNKSAEPATLLVYNHLGQPVKEVAVPSTSMPTTVIELPGVKPGVYFVRIVGTTTVLTKRVYLSE
jgi:hypothetical protein